MKGKMISRYLRKQVAGDRAVVFHQLHPDPTHCSAEDLRRLLGNEPLSPELRAELIRKKLLVSSVEEDDAEYERASRRLIAKHSRTTGLYLMTAQGCNLECEYCPVPGIARKYGESMLTEEMAIAGIELWFEHLKDLDDPDQECIVIFYGGEPLLNKEVIKASLRHLKESSHEAKPKKLATLIVTNGTLVDQQIVDMCKEHGVMVAVSLDGVKEAHDAFRVDAQGKSSYEPSVRAIEQLVSAGVRTFGSVTVGPHNMSRIAETVRLLSGLGIEKFGFNFIKGKQLIEVAGKEGAQRYHGDAARVAATASCGAGFEYQREKKEAAFATHDFFPHDCTCYGSQLVVQPDGQLSNCPFTKTYMGDVRTVGKGFRIWDQEVVKAWRKRLPLFQEGLQGSDALALCGPGCAWSSQELFGSLAAVDETNRRYSEEVFNELIWSRL